MPDGLSHVFSELFLHVTWHCHENRPMLTPEVEQALYPFISTYGQKNKGVHIGRMGGTENHVHLIMQIEPFVLISDVMGKIKGASAHEINHTFGRKMLQWQRGYGVVSFSKRHIGVVEEYVEYQKEHHRLDTITDVLERVGMS